MIGMLRDWEVLYNADCLISEGDWNKMKKADKKLCAFGIAALMTAAGPFQVTASPQVPAVGQVSQGQETEDSAPTKEYAEKLAKLQDDVMEYSELPDLIDHYNPTLSGAGSGLNDSIATYQNLVSSNQKNENEMKNWMKDLEKEYDFTESQGKKAMSGASKLQSGGQPTNEEMAALETINSDALTEYGTYMTNAMIFQGMAQSFDQAVDKMTKASATMQLDQARDSLVSATQGLMNQYNQLLSQRQMAEKSQELYTAVYDMTVIQQQAGLATANDVFSAQKDVMSAQSSLLQINNGISQIRQTLCTMTGWSWDANPEIQKIPSADPGKIDLISVAADAEKGINNNYTVRSIRKGSSSSNNRERSSKIRSVTEAEQLAAAGIHDQYQCLLQKRAEYDSAKTAYEGAKLQKEGTDRKYKLGMLSKIQYLQAELGYIQKKSAYEVADMALFQAMEDYDWAVAGLMSID